MKIKHHLPNSAQMRAEALRRLKAGEPLGAFHNSPPLPPGTVIAGSIMTAEQMRNNFGYSNPRKRARKHISEKTCGGGQLCLPGLNGKCVACSEDD